MRNEEIFFLDRQCNPMYVQGVRTFMNSALTGPQRFGRSWPDGPDVGRPYIFTNTAVPRFDGTGCWQQHLLVFRATMKSNEWWPDTAALQLFAHLDGEALRVALLMQGRIRERWKDLVDELSAYYNTLGRPAVIRRQFENAQPPSGVGSGYLRRHLDGAAREASIGDIVDSCRIWESHAEPIAIDNWCQDPTMVYR